VNALWVADGKNEFTPDFAALRVDDSQQCRVAVLHVKDPVSAHHLRSVNLRVRWRVDVPDDLLIRRDQRSSVLVGE